MQPVPRELTSDEQAPAASDGAVGGKGSVETSTRSGFGGGGAASEAAEREIDAIPAPKQANAMAMFAG
jgi:hypothetical protein